MLLSQLIRCKTKTDRVLVTRVVTRSGQFACIQRAMFVNRIARIVSEENCEFTEPVRFDIVEYEFSVRP